MVLFSHVSLRLMYSKHHVLHIFCLSSIMSYCSMFSNVLCTALHRPIVKQVVLCINIKRTHCFMFWHGFSLLLLSIDLCFILKSRGPIFLWLRHAHQTLYYIGVLFIVQIISPNTSFFLKENQISNETPLDICFENGFPRSRNLNKWSFSSKSHGFANLNWYHNAAMF